MVPRHLRHREPHEDIVGLMGLAFFLIAVSVAVALNPNLGADLTTWTHLVSSQSTPFVRPPEGVITSAAWFFGVVGVLEFVAASLRWALRWTRLRVAGRILAGAGDLVFSALLFLYSAKSIPGAFLLAILAGTVGVLLLIYVTLGLYWATARPMPRPRAAGSTAISARSPLCAKSTADPRSTPASRTTSQTGYCGARRCASRRIR